MGSNWTNRQIVWKVEYDLTNFQIDNLGIFEINCQGMFKGTITNEIISDGHTFGWCPVGVYISLNWIFVSMHQNKAAYYAMIINDRINAMFHSWNKYWPFFVSSILKLLICLQPQGQLELVTCKEIIQPLFRFGKACTWDFALEGWTLSSYSDRT